MKYLKKFEKIIYYNVGDYVLLDLERIKENTMEEFGSLESHTAKSFLPDDLEGKIDYFHYQEDYPYGIKLYNDKLYDIKTNEISRLLTSEEIEEFETKKESFKYNL